MAIKVLVVEYEGTCYCGFQLQTNAPTIQGEIEIALKKLVGEDIRVKAACRTDTGVHARGQVVSIQTDSALPLRAYVHGMNHHLPEDIAVISAEPASDDFNVRHATARQYSYFIDNGGVRSPLKRRFTHLVTQPLDTEAMDATCQELVGEHDFRSFATSLDSGYRSTVRRVDRA
ncbi:MAG: tRNA pseudouridine synthase A, partial [Dehalococcoidia bacterium]|nr:tRNA pseudouridine synthase A [Dehalococcoidia bacterium]